MKRKPAAQRREEVLRAALALFAQRGYDAVVMDEIARACGIARTSLYEYFRSKEEILLALIDQVIAQAPSGVPEAASIRERLVAIAAAQLAYIHQHRLVYRMLFEKLPSLSGPVADAIIARRQEQAVAVVALVQAGQTSGEIRPDVAVTDLVFLFQSVVSQLGSLVLLQEEPIALTAEADRLLGLLFAGVATR
ncbi:MAG TPA: TetR/AcrR family transcriptional regulator [Symbiobacteriaceae bacterium]|jgi:AcrR family transcriptional regulator|nr:TetR/AcrR family transcriptional regulator [Symbiobacteriaceae bacterium]